MMILSSSKASWSRQKCLKIAAGFTIFLALLIVALEVPAVRLNVFHVRDNRGSSVITSNDAHVKLIISGTKRVLNQPLGCGAGCSGPASYYGDKPAKISENYFLQIAEEYGVFGLFLIFAILFLIARKLYFLRARPIAKIWLSALGGYLVIGFLLHVLADEPLAVTWFIVAGGLYGANK
jgi:hypothetical protein